LYGKLDRALNREKAVEKPAVEKPAVNSFGGLRQMRGAVRRAKRKTVLSFVPRRLAKAK
jgi:hypothetical protein